MAVFEGDKEPDPERNPTGDPYTDWALRLMRDDPSRLVLQGKLPTTFNEKPVAPLQELNQLWVPLVVRVPDEALEELQERLVPLEPMSREDPPDLFAEGWQFPGPKERDPEAPVELLVYERLRGGSQLPDFVEVLQRLPVVTRFELPLSGNEHPSTGVVLLNEVLFRRRRPSRGGKQMIGIIDDGIGFLNGRFMRGDTSRFAGFWMMGDGPNAGAVPIANVAAQLDRRSEAEIYKELARDAFRPGTRHRLLSSESHGTHMLDLAAGAQPDDLADPMRDIELLGVQLPPQTYDDTSGRKLMRDLWPALRWLVLSAYFNGAERLLVNMSLGITAGPKDGTSTEEVIIQSAIAFGAFLGVKIEVFLPYGNSYQDQLAGELNPGPEQDAVIDWQIVPDDLTPGYFEIQHKFPSPVDLNDLEITVTPPGGPGQTIVAGPFGRIDEDIFVDGRVVGRVTFVPQNFLGRRDFIIVAFLPSRANPQAGFGVATAPAGRWSLRLVSRDNKMELTAQMQRDDRPAGALTGARQAYFEGPNTRAYLPRSRQFDNLDDTGPVVYRGSNSAFTQVRSKSVTTVGGAVVLPQADPSAALDIRPARYCAEGANWSGEQPDYGAITESDLAFAGIRAAGTFSSGTARLSGTSTASATATRHRLESGLGIASATQAVAGVDVARVGPKVIVGNRAIRLRRQA